MNEIAALVQALRADAPANTYTSSAETWVPEVSRRPVQICMVSDHDGTAIFQLANDGTSWVASWNRVMGSMDIEWLQLPPLPQPESLPAQD